MELEAVEGLILMGHVVFSMTHVSDCLLRIPLPIRGKEVLPQLTGWYVTAVAGIVVQKVIYMR